MPPAARPKLCRAAEIVISAVTADSAVAAAGQAAPHLTSSQTYIDLNSISPATKEQVADQVRQRGAELRRVCRHGSGERSRESRFRS